MFDLISDLHTEFGHWTMPVPTSPIVVVAGDFATACKHEKTIQLLLDLPYEHVIFVLGNHDFYHGDYNTVYSQWSTWSTDHPKLHVLLNSTILVNNILFIGSTLWSDTTNDGQNIKQHLSDYSAIRNFQLETGQHAHKCAVEYIDRVLTETTSILPVVIVTHHLPSFQCIDTKYDACTYNAGFATNLEWLLKKHQHIISVWVHGHTHTSIDTVIEGVRVVCNPRGYPHETMDDYKPKQILLDKV
jgi:predicted phosphohydrolase